jgi:hypothetical protein
MRQSVDAYSRHHIPGFLDPTNHIYKPLDNHQVLLTILNEAS